MSNLTSSTGRDFASVKWWCLPVLVFGLLQNTYARAEDITVRITDIQYGIATRSGRPITGSYIDQVPTSFEIVEVTDRIPMTPGTYFGFEMDVHASEGKTLQIAVVWQGPDGATLNSKTVAGSIRNGRQLKKSFSFAPSDRPGK